jgi:GTPase
MLLRIGMQACRWSAPGGTIRTTVLQWFLPASSFSTKRVTDELIVAILGPPNAGKSTLFNRLMCKSSNRSYRLSSDKKHRSGRGRLGNSSKTRPHVIGGAIVSSTAGTTRDRRECIGRIGGTTFRLVDTAGVDGERLVLSSNPSRNPLEKDMMQQTLAAAQEADLILLMLDAKVGITADLLETTRWLRRISDDKTKRVMPREVVILANKLEGDRWNHNGSMVIDHLDEVSRVGFGDAIPISAEHGEGMADIATIIEELKEKKRIALGLPIIADNIEDANVPDEAKPLQLAILGRQNVGKSTLVNALLKRDRVICGPTPGLTRDAIAIEWQWKNRPVQLVDTAGIRRFVKRDHTDAIEDLAVLDAMRAMKVADVAVLVLDAEAKVLQRQELAIADAVIKEGRALVVVANKMDLLVDAEYTHNDYADAVRRQIEMRLPMLRMTPVVAMSSLTGAYVEALMPVVFKARDRWARVISTGLLNRWLKEVMMEHPPPMTSGRPTKIKYITQTKGRPPTFLLFCNVAELPMEYVRFLLRNFQDSFEYFGMEVRMAVKKSSENPFDKGKKRGGSGLGGKEARKKRNLHLLRSTGTTKLRRRRRPSDR